METGNRSPSHTHEAQQTRRSGAQKGPRLSKYETSRYLANHPGQGERPLRRAADALGLSYETSPPVLHWYPDLVFRKIKLIVEVDGGHHFDKEQIVKDKIKDKALKKKGWTVIRVWSGDAKRDPSAVLYGAFTRAFGVGAEEDAMNQCRGPVRKLKPPGKPKPPNKRVRTKIELEQKLADRKREQAQARRQRNKEFDLLARERYEERLNGRRVAK